MKWKGREGYGREENVWELLLVWEKDLVIYVHYRDRKGHSGERGVQVQGGPVASRSVQADVSGYKTFRDGH